MKYVLGMMFTGLLIGMPLFMFAEEPMDLSHMALLLQSLQVLVQNLAGQVNQYIPITLAAPQETDLTKDGIVEEHDWLYMRDRWFTNDDSADINKDGVVNAIDFGLMNRNWNKLTN